MVLLLAGGGTIRDYLAKREVLTDGTPGTFTLHRCARVTSGESRGARTWCYGTFRADDDRWSSRTTGWTTSTTRRA